MGESCTSQVDRMKSLLRDCFLPHHKGHKEHEGWTIDGQNSSAGLPPSARGTVVLRWCKSVAEHGLKGVLTRLQTT